MSTEKLTHLLSWRDMLLALDQDGNLLRLTVDPMTNKATATWIPVNFQTKKGGSVE